MDENRLSALGELEERLGLRFQDVKWLDQAMIHRSFAYETQASREGANEVLEFLGDAVLNLAVSHYLLKEFPGAYEGMLSKVRAHLVKQTSLAALARVLHLDQYLLLGKGELLSGGRKKPSILANAYEALIGAVYSDLGFDQALEMVEHHLTAHLPPERAAHLFQDYKSQLQEHVQRTLGQQPEYSVFHESGPDHDKRFQASVSVGKDLLGIGWGKSKKEAQQEAAKKALDELSTKFQAPAFVPQGGSSRRQAK